MNYQYVWVPSLALEQATLIFEMEYFLKFDNHTFKYL